MAEICVVVCDTREYSIGIGKTDWPPESLIETVAWFQSKLEEVPEERRHKVTCTIGSDSEWDSSYSTIKISYYRPETPEEEEQRLAKERQRFALRQEQEVANALAVLKRYGVNNG